MPSEKIKLALKHLSRHDKVLSTIIKNNGIINLTQRRKYFNLIVSSIIGQQLSTYAAAAIEERFFNYFQNNLSPDIILQTDDSALRSLGLSAAKCRYVKDLSGQILDGKISLNGLSKKSDNEVIAELTKVKGIGVWTSHMFLIFTLGRINVLPTGDLGIRKAIMLNYGLKNLPNEKKILSIAEKNRWDPYCSVASLYLWRSLDSKKES